MRTTWIIDEADTDAGIPLSAHCTACGLVWDRPVWDRNANTLPEASLMHRCIDEYENGP